MIDVVLVQLVVHRVQYNVLVILILERHLSASPLLLVYEQLMLEFDNLIKDAFS